MTPRAGGELVEALRRSGLLIRAPEGLGQITGIAMDSRRVGQGGAFIAVRGSQQDGHQFVGAAVAGGASLIIGERATGAGPPEVIVSDGRRAAITAAKWWYGDPAARLSLLGVTGTSGKTTTTLLARHLLNGDGRAGSIGTLGAFDGADRPVASTAGSLTTPGPIDLVATLAGLLAAGVERVAMETSSHSLDQGRLDGLSFDGAVFTNLSREHLDYHRSMDEYRDAKLKLLDLMSPRGVVVVNADDPAWDGLARRPGVIGFGSSPMAQVRAEGIVMLPTSSRFRLAGRFGSAEATLPLPGAFNVANALGAAALALGLGRSLDEVVARLAIAPQVPGRMERIAERPCVVLRDYAHKPDALERVLDTLRPITPGKLICLFGCGGDRDRGKRPIMAGIAAQRSDLVIVTSDNPRTEDPDRILDDIVTGLPPGTAYERLPDRREAIRRAIAMARPGDTLLLAGKGHETYQVIGKDYLPFDEREIVREAIGSAP
ncbi:MAG: UDP-N-acetylmuramoyl-L-alanyl-D-glutamate--2,6-diaminopimelate ligase [Gemmatimonadetes bacterium]|nr:UDP-N-acetylmuramoyl-L-alanyl-D-glutamate--2,6-diaminopimelate ligase [Gemmatimonadota bacterium]